MFREIAADMSCQIDCVTTLAEVRHYLLGQSPGLIIFDVHVADGTWRDVLDRQTFAVEPRLLIVTSDHADDCLWAEVLNLGGYDVIAKPFNKVEARYVFLSAMMRKGGARALSSNSVCKRAPLVLAAGA